MIRNLFITLGLSVALLMLGLFVFLPKGEAQKIGILPQLIEIPAPPPPNPHVQAVVYEERPTEFFSDKNPPADDAPIEDLLTYWASQNNDNEVMNLQLKPSDRVIERLLDHIENNPEIINSYLNVLARKPQSVETVKRIYDRSLNKEDAEKYQLTQLRGWLKYNSDYFSDELLEVALQVKDAEEYVTNQDELLALSKVNFDKARPILDRLLNDRNQPVSQTLARWAFYLNAIKEGNSIEAGNYRSDLMRTVEDKNAQPGNRDLAMDALVSGGDFPGRDDWYFSLLEDDTLHDLRVNGRSYTGLTTILTSSPAGKYTDKMLELLASNNQKVRSAAVRNLMSSLREVYPVMRNKNSLDPRVIKALLPWLENPNWAKEISGERRLLVNALAQVEMPESVPGLIAVLNEKGTVGADDDDDDYEYPINAMASNRISDNTATAVARAIARTRDVYPYRDSAINALIKQKNFQAAAALRDVLPQVPRWKRDDVIKGILVSGGFTISEQVEALELRARDAKNKMLEYEKIQQIRGNTEGEEVGDYDIGYATTSAVNVNASIDSKNETFNPSMIKPMLGEQMINIGEPGNELVSAVTFRINSLERTEPEIAEIIRGIIQNWRGEAVNALLLSGLAEGKTDVDAIVKLLSLRKEMRQNQSGNIYDARSKGNPIAVGISACLLENPSDYSGILANAEDDAKIALLGCARLIRAPLSLQTVAAFLKSSNKTLALAAERYIESEDSPAARQIIYSLYPNDAKILGATFFFGEKGKMYVHPDFLAELFASVNDTAIVPPYYFYSTINKKDDSTEEKLRKEIKEDEKLIGIYAYNKNYVRIYQNKAVFSWEEDDARYFERELSDSEFGYLKSFFASNDVGNLPPFLSCLNGCGADQLLMLGKAGGRRVFVAASPKPQFFNNLEQLFEDMQKPAAKLHYWLEKDIAGSQILFADKDLQAVAVWKNGDDLRVLINNTQREEQIDSELEKLAEADQENENLGYSEAMILDRKRRSQRAFESYSWHKFAGNKLGDFSTQPAGVNFIRQIDMSQLDEYYVSSSAKAGNVEIRSGGESLYKVVGGRSTKILSGYYRNPVISSNGRWVVLTKYVEEENAAVIVRVNLQNNRETRVKFDANFRFAKPLSFISSANKVLLVAGNAIDYQSDSIKKGKYFLLDTETGTVQATKGEFRPFMQETFRQLQKTANADEVWAAIPDESKKETQIGRYNTKTFDFKAVLTVPQISFDSMNMWVDETINKVYIVYNGQLLSVPLRKEETKEVAEGN